METPRAFVEQSLMPYIRRRSFYLEAGALLLGFLFGRVEVFFGLLPFGVAFLAAADMAGINVHYPFVGAMIGALFALPQGVSAICAAVGYAVIRDGYILYKKRARQIDKLLIFAIVELLMLPLFYMEDFPSFLYGLSGLAMALLLCIAFQNGLRALRGFSVKKRLHEEEQVAICVLCGALSLSLCDISTQDFSLGIACIVWAAMFMVYARGLSAVAVAVALSGMMVMGGKAHPLLLADMAICTLMSVLCKRMIHVWGVAVGFTICCAITEQYFGIKGQHIGIINTMPAAIALVLIPRQGLLFLRAAVDHPAREERTARAAFRRMQAAVAEDIKNTALTVGKVAGLFPGEADWAYDAALERHEVQQAVYYVCASCAHRGACWRNTEELLTAIEDMAGKCGKGVRPRPAPPMESTCTLTAEITAAVMNAQESYRRQCTLAYRSEEQKAFAHRQLAGVGQVMQTLSMEVSKQPWPDEDAAEVLSRRLEQAGIPVRSVAVQKLDEDTRLEMRLPKMPIEECRLEEAVSRAMGRPMRLLRAEQCNGGMICQLEKAQALSPATGFATRTRGGNGVSGDSTGYVKLKNGRALFVLSDGMGSGIAARAQSREAVDLLLKLYQVGLNRDAALECVNRLLMQQGEQDMYATVDALHVNLQSGETEFIKFGAPPSFVLRKGKVHTVYAEALPAGILDEAAPAINMATLQRNDMVVLLTDGVLDALKEEAAEEILRCVGGANTCTEAAEELLAAARERSEEDDMTVLVARME